MDIHPEVGLPGRRLTMLHAGGKFGGADIAYPGSPTSGGFVVNALSEWLEVEVRRNGFVYQQKYQRGVPVTDLIIIGKTKRTGTKITFKPDCEIFEELTFNHDTLSHRLRELSFLNMGIKIILRDSRIDSETVFQHDGGIRDYVKFLNKNKTPLHSRPIHFQKQKDNVLVEVALQYTDTYVENIGLSNNINTITQTHEAGFKMTR